MVEDTQNLLEQALKLPAIERMRLAHDLLESVDEGDVGEFTPEWIEEIQRRVQRVLTKQAGPDEDWRIVLDRIRRRADRSA